MEAWERIVCAVDVEDEDRALGLVRTLRGRVGVFKVGLELTCSTGMTIVSRLQEAGAERIFLDIKLHDIPNTVAGAMRAVAKLGVWSVTLHIAGGSAMLRAASQAARSACEASGVASPKLLGVTLLTSLDAEELRYELNVSIPLSQHVGRLACLARESGCHGVITSPHEIETIRQAVPDRDFLIVTPGVRPRGSGSGDQARVTTPYEAIRKGADYLVIGRPLTQAQDQIEAADRIAAEMDAVMREAL